MTRLPVVPVRRTGPLTEPPRSSTVPASLAVTGPSIDAAVPISEPPGWTVTGPETVAPARQVTPAAVTSRPLWRPETVEAQVSTTTVN